MPSPSEEFAHLDYRTRWLLYRNAYKAVTAGALVLGVLFAWFTGPRLADQLWPNRYRPGVDHIVRDNGLLPNEEGWRVEAWRKPNGRVASRASAGVPGESQVEGWGMTYWAGLLALGFFGGRPTLLPYRRRLGLLASDCGFFTMWARETPAFEKLLIHREESGA